jgi:hypothetical protein
MIRRGRGFRGRLHHGCLLAAQPRLCYGSGARGGAGLRSSMYTVKLESFGWPQVSSPGARRKSGKRALVRS